MKDTKTMEYYLAFSACPYTETFALLKPVTTRDVSPLKYRSDSTMP